MHRINAWRKPGTSRGSVLPARLWGQGGPRMQLLHVTWTVASLRAPHLQLLPLDVLVWARQRTRKRTDEIITGLARTVLETEKSQNLLSASGTPGRPGVIPTAGNPERRRTNSPVFCL